MLRTSSRFHTFVYALLLTVILICSTIHLSANVAGHLDPADPANMIYMSAIVSCVLAPPASLMLAIYSNRLIRVQEQLHSLATTDPLTGLLNRRAFEEFYKKSQARMTRTNERVSLMLMDLDHFKNINARFGHSGGDIALRNFAECLRTTVRFGTDEVARWGGEEFAVLLSDTNRDAAMKAALRFLKNIKALSIPFADQEMRLSASIGVIECSAEETLEAAIKRADSCLAIAKKQGRARAIVHPQRAETVTATAA